MKKRVRTHAHRHKTKGEFLTKNLCFLIDTGGMTSPYVNRKNNKLVGEPYPYKKKKVIHIHVLFCFTLLFYLFIHYILLSNALGNSFLFTKI